MEVFGSGHRSSQTMQEGVRGTVYQQGPTACLSKDVHRVPKCSYLNRRSVRRDDAEGTRGRPGARGAAGADCCRGNSGRGGGGSGGRLPAVLLLLSIHLPGDTVSVTGNLIN